MQGEAVEATNERAAALARGLVPFTRLTPEELQSTIDALGLVRCAAGQQIFADGDPSDGLYVILDGRVDAIKDGTTIMEMSRGTVVGELSLFTIHGRRTATARAITEALLLHWPVADFRRRLDANETPAMKVAVDLAQLLAERLKRRTEAFMRMRSDNGRRSGGGEFEEFKRQMLSESLL